MICEPAALRKRGDGGRLPGGRALPGGWRQNVSENNGWQRVTATLSSPGRGRASTKLSP